MARESLVGLIAAHLRRGIIDGEYEGALPSERTLRQQLGCNRSTLQLALTTLKAEGLVHSVPGVSWYVNPIEQHASFELIRRRFAMSPRSEWPARMRELLAYRSTLYIALVDALVRQGLKVPDEAKFRAFNLRYLRENAWYPHDVLEEEEAFFIGLTDALDNLSLKLALHSVRRVFEQFRFRFPMSFSLRPLSAQLDALMEAIDGGDRALAWMRANELAAARDGLHLELAQEVASSEEPRSEEARSA